MKQFLKTVVLSAAFVACFTGLCGLVLLLMAYTAQMPAATVQKWLVPFTAVIGALSGFYIFRTSWKLFRERKEKRA